MLVITDGGKVELWDLETGTTVRSVRGHDEDAVTAVKVTMVTSNSVQAGGRAGVTRCVQTCMTGFPSHTLFDFCATIVKQIVVKVQQDQLLVVV